MSKNTKKKVAVIGCTGSVGSSALDVCRSYPEFFQVTALAAETGREALPSLCREFAPRIVVLQKTRYDLPKDVALWKGEEALLRLVESDEVEHIVLASSGVAAVKALARAMELGKEISLANKESALIMGERLTAAVRGGQIRPLDSEHNALWQCLAGENYDHVERLVLTASGGPFLRTPLEQLDAVTPEQAASHPVWPMGRKISVDSATMINKGIELLEAHDLFGIPGEKILPVIHPGSKVHALVSFVDGATKMLLSSPDMRLAALTALSWPMRLPQRMKKIEPVELDGLDLHFERPQKERFPGLYTAIEAAGRGEPYPVVLIAADEAAVRMFLERKIGFADIAKIVSAVVDGYSGGPAEDISSRVALYERCRGHALELANERSWGRKKVWS